MGNTALYAVNFWISDAFSFANLIVHYAADDTPSFLSGFILNGTVICQSQVAVGFSQGHAPTGDVSSVLQVGTNWLYFDIVNHVAGSSAGLIFSATTTTTPEPTPSINAGGVVNAANYAAPVAPGSIAAAFGNLAATLNNNTGDAQAVNLSSFAPAIFSQNSEGSGQGAIFDTSYQLVDVSNPATAGVTHLQIYCTGLGPVSNQPASGYPASSSQLAETPTTPMVSIGNVPARVLFSGLAPGYVGLYQVNA